MAERVNVACRCRAEAERAATPPRDYLGGSRLGHACERALQFEFTATPKDDGADFLIAAADCRTFRTIPGRHRH